MSQVLDPLNLLLLGIAAVVIWRLYAVLGSRTGNERPPQDLFPPAPAPRSTAETPAKESTIARPVPSPAKGDDSDQSAPVWKGYAPENSALAKGLEAVAAADPSFKPKSFVAGARLAYEMIVESFAKGDKNTLRPLLAKDVLDGFIREIEERNSRNLKLETRFVGIEKCEIVAAELNGNQAALTVRFVSQMISATRNMSGEIVEGDDKEVRLVTDVWTFERDVGSRDPNWLLAATEDAS
jgi:predicted lipid-binding transport protein (Tim44 family)